MTVSLLGAPRLRAALGWWCAAAADRSRPQEADFLSQNPREYAQLLSDAFIVDMHPGGDLMFRFVGTELSDYIGWAVSGTRVDLRAQRRDADLIRDVLVSAAARATPFAARGRFGDSAAPAQGDAQAFEQAPDSSRRGPPDDHGLGASANDAARSDYASRGFEAICLPLATSAGRPSLFGAIALAGYDKLPPATAPARRVRVDMVSALGDFMGSDAACPERSRSTG